MSSGVKLFEAFPAKESSNIKSVHTCVEQGMLIVEFMSGGKYLYVGVPANVVEEFKKSESYGKFFTSGIRNKYVSIQLP